MMKKMKILLLLMAFFSCKKADEVIIPKPDTVVKHYQLVWSDEFNKTELDTTNWNFEVNGDGGGNNELQYYTDLEENCFIEDSCLYIRALKKDYNGKNYTSARINSNGKGDWKYGKFVVRAKLPFGQGLWPAIWMLPTDWIYGGWPLSGEIDIMEELGQEPQKIYGTIHFGDPHQYSEGNYSLLNGSFSDNFHDFIVEWTQTDITWLVDSTTYYSVHMGKPFDQKFHFVMNVAVGGNWPGDPNENTVFPQDMIIDYVRVYQLK